MISNSQLSLRLARASAVLHKSSVKALILKEKNKASGKVQMSWGSAMRR